MSIDTKIPNVVWPAKSGKYKVAQFYVDEKPYLRFGNIVTDTSPNSQMSIVKRFTKESRLRTIVDESSGRFRLLPADKSFEIAGMGWCELNLEEKTAEYFGISFGYELRIDEKHLKSIKPFSQGVNIVYNPRRYQ